MDRKLSRLAYGNAKRDFTFPTDELTKDHSILRDESPFYNFVVCFFFKGLNALGYAKVGNPHSMSPTTLPFAG